MASGRRSTFHAQGGPALPDETPMQTRSGIALPTTKETFDITNPQHQVQAIARMTRYGLEHGTTHPDVVSEGAQWFRHAHAGIEATRGKLSLEQGAGIAAVASPSSDWDVRNQHVLGQVQNLRGKDWNLIHRTHGEATEALAARRASGEASSTERVQRHEDVTAMLSERAPLLTTVSNPQLLKTHAILKGADPAEVMPRATSPKTNAFYHGLLNPEHAESHVPIDYRMADMVSNTMRPYQIPAGGSFASRGLDKGARPGSAGERRYEAYERVVGAAGRNMAKRGGSQFAEYSRPLASQAGFWNMGKGQEMAHPEAREGMGPRRTGQPYMTARGAPVRA